MERLHPDVSEFDMVLIAPAPGVNEMRAPAATRVSQTDHDMGRRIEMVEVTAHERSQC
ncbi:hypothetical protein GCM10022376_24180 [Yimella lutea]